MTRIERIIREISDLFDFYRRIARRSITKQDTAVYDTATSPTSQAADDADETPYRST